MRTSPWLGLLALGFAAFPAAGEGPSPSPSPLTVDGGLVIWTLVVFGLLLFILRRSAWPVLLNAVRERERRLEEQIAEAEKNRAEAAALLEQHRKLLAGARTETQEILAKAKAVAEKKRADTDQQTDCASSQEDGVLFQRKFVSICNPDSIDRQ